MFIYILYSLELSKDKVEPHAMYNRHGICTLIVGINRYISQPTYRVKINASAFNYPKYLYSLRIVICSQGCLCNYTDQWIIKILNFTLSHLDTHKPGDKTSG